MPDTPIRLLLVSDDRPVPPMLIVALRRRNYRVTYAESIHAAAQHAELEGFDVALLDLPAAQSIDLLTSLRCKQPLLEVLAVLDYGSAEHGAWAMQAGAFGYLLRPFSIQDLDLHLRRAYEKVQLVKRERQWIEHARRETPPRLVGVSPAHQRLKQLIAKMAPSDVPVLITGPQGADKWLIARHLHEKSTRRDRPFVHVSCAGVSEHLLESELFGRTPAGCGVSESTPSALEAAEGGTLFLEEIAGISLHLQAKLLRLVEAGVYRRVGSAQETSADVRLLAASSRALDDELGAGRFREDLYERLSLLSIAAPPLHGRRQDIPLLAEQCLDPRSPRGRRLAPEALEALQSYRWPGDVRELAAVLKRAQLLADQETIRLNDLPSDIVESSWHQAGVS